MPEQSTRSVDIYDLTRSVSIVLSCQRVLMYLDSQSGDDIDVGVLCEPYMYQHGHIKRARKGGKRTC